MREVAASFEPPVTMYSVGIVSSVLLHLARKAFARREFHFHRSTGDEGIDFSLLVDGLSAEREQGININVAYRFFTTDQCKFIVAEVAKLMADAGLIILVSFISPFRNERRIARKIADDLHDGLFEK